VKFVGWYNAPIIVKFVSEDQTYALCFIFIGAVAGYGPEIKLHFIHIYITEIAGNVWMLTP